MNHPPRRDGANKREAEGKLQAEENNPGIKRLVKASGCFQIDQKVLVQYHRNRGYTLCTLGWIWVNVVEPIF